MRRLALSLTLLAAACGPAKEAEPLLTLPEFSMTRVGPKEDSPFGRQELLGKVWLVDFVFTRCDGPCPLLSAHFMALNKSLPPAAKLLSISVDPEYDDGPKLREYAARHGSDLERWVFLRGDVQETYRLLYTGFRVPMSIDPKAPAGSRVTHSTRFALVDKKGGIRRFYDGLDSRDDAEIARDVAKLLQEP